ncbi:MAG: hypothetical protein ACRDPG_03310, partial [Nocardioidaceae bacterium]
MTRRHMQIALGLLWILDGALQFQPFMFTSGLSNGVIAPAGQGQPIYISSGVGWAADLILAHPVVLDALFATLQIAIGLGLLLRATVRPALVASICWAFGVWYFGEGAGGIASGHADMLTGAPGAVLLYAVLAAAAWPARNPPASTSATESGSDVPAAWWLPWAWALLWVGTAVLVTLPGQNTAADLAAEIRGNADGAPAWLAQLDRTIASG